MKVGFYLDNAKKEVSALRAIVRHKGQRYTISIGESVIPKYWNDKTHRCRTVRDYSEASHINARLDDWTTLIEDAINSFGLIVPTLDMVRGKVEGEILKRNVAAGGISSDEDSQYFISFVNNFIKQAIRAERTITSYTTCRNKLVEYEQVYKTRLRFIDIDINFYNKFKRWMLEETYVKSRTIDADGNIIENRLHYSKNYIGGIFKHIVTFMNVAKSQKLHNFDNYENKNFKVEQEETDSIYLNQEEIIKIYNLEFTEDFLISNGYDARPQNLRLAMRSLSEERDRFLIGCLTALRHSDYTRLDSLNFKESLASIWTKKKDKKVYIPMHFLLKKILKRRNNILPETISDQKHNDQIKIIGKLAGIKEEVIISKTRGGQREETIKPKYEFITSHTARRSGATNMYLAGVDLKFIQDILGHSKIEQTIKYIKVSAEDNAKRLVDHPYFSGK